MVNSIYYTETVEALDRGDYISPHQMLFKFKSYPFFDEQHAKTEINKAVQHGYTVKKES